MEFQEIQIDKEKLELPKLTAKVQRTVDLYIANGCKGKGPAYQHVYGSKPSTAAAAANKLFKRDDIQEYISKVSKHHTVRSLEKYSVTVDRVYKELTRMSYFNVKHFYDKDQKPIPLKDLPEDLTVAIQEVRADGTYKFADKGQNLDRLAKSLNMYQTDQKQQQVVLVNAPTITKPRKTGT